MPFRDPTLLTYPGLRAAVLDLGYAWFDSAPFDINLVGLRTLPGVPDRFDDRILLAWRDDFEERVEVYPATLDPGAAWLSDPANTNGSFVVGPGQYRGALGPGTHHGKTPCLAVVGELRGVRRLGTTERPARVGPSSGIQVHARTGLNTPPTTVGRWSDGCMVLAYQTDLDRVLALCATQASRGLGSRLTLTVLESK